MTLTHHAYYLEDSPLLFDSYQNGIRSSQKFDEHDPGFVARRYERFGIDEARALQELASLKSAGSATLFFISASSITSEAQQALLKLFEEPQRGVAFILLLPPGALLSTLRSRMLPYTERLAAMPPSAQAQKFLMATPKARSAYIAELLDEEEWARDRIRDFLAGLEAALRGSLARPEARAGLEDIAKVRSYLGDRSPSLKMLLEHFALSLPKL